jgi:plasmid stability protein
MATLHVRNVPDKLYKRIQKLAEQENRSLTAEVVNLLDQAVQERQARQSVAAVLERVRGRTATVRLPKGWIDSVDLIREDRDR